MIAAALERGIDVDRRARARLAGDPQPLPRGDRDQRQDDDRRAARPRLPDRRRAGRGGRQRRHAALLARRRGRARRDRHLRGLQLPARGHASTSPPSAQSSSTSPPTTSTATATSSPTWPRSCGSSPTRATTTSPSTTPTTRRWPGSTSAAAPGGSPSASAPPPTARSRWPRGRSSTTASRCSGSTSSGLFGEHNVANAMAAAAAALAMGIDRDAVREGLRSFAGVPHRLEQVAEIDGVRFVNDSKATNVASATVGLRAFEGGVHAILGGSDKGEDFAPLLEPVRESCAAVYLIGATCRPPRRGAGRRSSRPASSCTAAPTSRTPCGAPPPRPARARSSCSRRPAPASTPSRTSSSAASASARSSGSWLVSSLRRYPRPRREVQARQAQGLEAEGKGAKRRARAAERADRVQHAADRDPLPAGVRRGDGLLGQLDHQSPQRRRPLGIGLLPETDPAGRRRRPAGHALRRSPRARLGPAPDPGRSSPSPSSCSSSCSSRGARSTARAAGSAPASCRSSPRSWPRSRWSSTPPTCWRASRSGCAVDRGADAVPAGRRLGLAADRDRARHGHGAGRRLRRRGDAGRRRRPDARPGADRPACSASSRCR